MRPIMGALIKPKSSRNPIEIKPNLKPKSKPNPTESKSKPNQKSNQNQSRSRNPAEIQAEILEEDPRRNPIKFLVIL